MRVKYKLTCICTIFIFRNLNTSNCLIDASFRVKISNFGLEIDCFKSIIPENKLVHDKRLYMAPEVLRSYVTNNDEPTVLRRCDIYSFAIVTQEVLYRSGPFYVLDKNITLAEKLSRIQAVKEEPFRPFLGNRDDNVRLHNIALYNILAKNISVRKC